MKFVLKIFLLPLLFTALAGFAGCSSEVDPAADEDPQDFTEKAYQDPEFLEQSTRTVD